LQTIFITHEHLDHILGLYTILNELSDSELEIYVSNVTQKILAQGNEEQICPRSLGISASAFGVSILPIPISKTHALAEGDTFSFGSFSFQVMETPGHSPGSITLYESTHKLLFPGDVVFPQGSFGRYDFPGGNLSTLTQSIKRLTDLDVEVLGAGHMAPVVRNASQQIQLSYRNISSMRW
ncbi:MAG: MBL fold metallo-hydrolase, partial [Promethearchaeota archaeon]